MTSRFGFISAHHAAYGVKRLCRRLNVSRSGFYRWRRAAPERVARADKDAQLAERIRAVHADSGGTYGSPRAHTELRETGMRVNRKRIERIMREHRIIGRHHRRPFGHSVPTTEADDSGDDNDDNQQHTFSLARRRLPTVRGIRRGPPSATDQRVRGVTCLRRGLWLADGRQAVGYRSIRVEMEAGSSHT
jgi:hypothetical protein